MSEIEYQAGRSLDILVAEKVMGLKQPVSGYAHDLFGEEDYKAYEDYPKPYSMDITCAWEVVEKLRADSNNHMIEIYWDVDSWYCTIHSHDNKPNYLTGYKSAPLMICVAALTASGNQ